MLGILSVKDLFHSGQIILTRYGTETLEIVKYGGHHQVGLDRGQEQRDGQPASGSFVTGGRGRGGREQGRGGREGYLAGSHGQRRWTTSDEDRSSK